MIKILQNQGIGYFIPPIFLSFFFSKPVTYIDHNATKPLHTQKNAGFASLFSSSTPQDLYTHFNL